jgi:hypothetical protein
MKQVPLEALDFSLSAYGVAVSVPGSDRRMIVPWGSLIAAFVDDLIVETEAGTATRMSMDDTEQEIYAVIDGLRSAASDVDEIFEPLLDEEFDGDPAQPDLFDYEEVLFDVKGNA